MTYSREFKLKAVHLYLDGYDARETAKLVGCSHKIVLIWVRQFGYRVRTQHESRKRKK